MSADPGQERPRSAADEAARLIEAVSERACAHLADDRPAGEHPGHDGSSPECFWCPLCRAVSFVRDTDPELRARVVASATALAVSLRDLAESAVRPRTPADRADGSADSPAGESAGESAEEDADEDMGGRQWD